MPQRIISVIGPESPSEAEVLVATELGREVARRGFVLVCNGLGGVPEAACAGAKEQDGLTVGILPGRTKSPVNPHVDVPIVTDTGDNETVVVLSGDGVVAVGVNAKTFAELSKAWAYKKPIVTMAGMSGWADKIGGVQIDDTRSDQVLVAKDPKEALDLLGSNFS